MKDFYMENLRQAREKRGITQVKMSVDLEIAQETISGYEIGRITPSIQMLNKIADYLNTTTDYLLGRINTDIPIMNIKQNDITETESQLIFDYRHLNEQNQKELLWYVNALKQKENKN